MSRLCRARKKLFHGIFGSNFTKCWPIKNSFAGRLHMCCCCGGVIAKVRYTIQCLLLLTYRDGNCFTCLLLIRQHRNVLQYKESKYNCFVDGRPEIETWNLHTHTHTHMHACPRACEQWIWLFDADCGDFLLRFRISNETSDDSVTSGCAVSRDHVGSAVVDSTQTL